MSTVPHFSYRTYPGMQSGTPDEGNRINEAFMDTLKRVLPYAESRVEDLAELAAAAKGRPEGEALRLDWEKGRRAVTRLETAERLTNAYVLETLIAVLPYAISRAEDLAALAEGPEGSEAAIADWMRAEKAVNEARCLLAHV